jgi:flagellar motor switch protein FliM
MRRKRKNQKRQRKAKKDEDTPTEILSQEEIDALLTAISSPETERDEVFAAFAPADDCRKIKIYDFKRPDKFSKEQIRIACVLHEIFARYAESVLTEYFKLPLRIYVAAVDQLTCEEIVRLIPSPSVLTVIDLDLASRKQAVIEIDPAVSFVFINRAFGGKEEYDARWHDLTRLDWLVVADVINRMLKCLKIGWEKIACLSPKINRMETNPQFLNIAPPSEMFLRATMPVKIGGIEGMINISYPHSCREGIADKLSEAFWYGGNTTPLKNYRLVSPEDIPIELIAEVFRRDYSIRGILKWKEEELLLPLRPCEPGTCYLRIGNRRVWYCEILREEKWFSKKIKLIKPAESFAGSEGKMEIIDKGNPAVAESLFNAGVTISAELGGTSMPIRDILSLKEGSIIELDRQAGEPADIRANGVLIAKVEVVVIEENFGIRIVEIAKPVKGTNEPRDSGEV